MNAPFGWPGGKRYLLKTLLKLIPPHKAYVEVFSGSAKLLFAKEPSQFEVLNDINDDLLTFFRVAKHRPAELAEIFEHEFVGFGRFRELRAERSASARDCELRQALRFAYLVWWSFGCKGENFAHATVANLNKKHGAIRRTICRVRELLHAASERLRSVAVDQRDFADCIQRYDSPETFFYLDPPYVEAADVGQYGPMEEKRNRELLELLRRVRGKFLLSFDNAPLVRELAARFRFHLKPVKVIYTLNKDSQKQVRELLIANYAIK